MAWQALNLTLKWPQYYRPDSDEQKRLSDQVAADYDAGLITLETAVERIASMYGIEDVAEYVEKLKAEKAERMNGLHEAMAGLNAGADRGAAGESDGLDGGNAGGRTVVPKRPASSDSNRNDAPKPGKRPPPDRPAGRGGKGRS